MGNPMPRRSKRLPFLARFQDNYFTGLPAQILFDLLKEKGFQDKFFAWLPATLSIIHAFGHNRAGTYDCAGNLITEAL